jgi:hypothetical protein
MRGFAPVFAVLLAAGVMVTHATPANPKAAGPVFDAVLDCRNESAEVSLQISIRNQGPDDLPAGTTIAYSYSMSEGGAVKNGSYRLDAVLGVGESRSFLVSPLQSWYPPIYRCRARVFRLKKSALQKSRRN